MRRILCLHLPNWPIQRVLAGRNVGQVSNLPCILHARDPRRGQIVVAASDAAKSCGIRLGMPLAQVVGTLRVPSPSNGTRSVPTTFSHDPAADLAELARLAEHCERFSPLVGWQTVEAGGQRSEVRGQSAPTWNLEPGTWNSLFCDVTGIGILFGGEERLAEEIVADMARLGYTARVAIADTIGAAWAAATMRNAECGMRKGKSDDLPTILPPLRTPHSALCTWPLESLRLPVEILDLLTQLGLKQIADLVALPRTSLRARFGELVLLRLDQLTGAAQETIVAHRPLPNCASEWVLEYPAERRDVIDQIVRELVSRVAAELAGRREGIVQLHCRLDCGTGKRDAYPTKIEVGLFRPSADARHLWDLLRMQLEQTKLPGPVGRITLQAVTTAPLENRQAELFAGGRDEADRQLALLIDRLSSRLGPEAVLQPQLTSDPLPEGQWSGVRSQESRVGQKRGARNSERGAKRRRRSFPEPRTLNPEPFFRPLFLRRPLALDAVSVVPDGPPINFRYQGKLHHVAHHWGPERIETGWFRGTSIRRDYYRVQTEGGLRFWLFRQLGDGRWHLHGEFS